MKCEEPREPIKLICPKCKYKWNYKGKSYRTICPRCSWNDKKTVWIKTGLTFPKTIPTIPSTIPIQDNILSGNLIDALEDAEMSPLRDTRYIRDSIFHIINDAENAEMEPPLIHWSPNNQAAVRFSTCFLRFLPLICRLL